MEKIEQRIYDQVISDSFDIEAIEFKDGEVKIKVSEFQGPVFTDKSDRELNYEQCMALMQIRKGIDFFKGMDLPDERELELQFLDKRETEIQLKGISFDEKEQEALKEKVMALPSIEKIDLRKVELKFLPKLEIYIFVLKFESKNKITMFSDEDTLQLVVNGVTKDHPNFEHYSELLAAIKNLFSSTKKYLHDVHKERRVKFEKRLRDYTLEASQGNLFKDINDFDKRTLETKIRKMNEQFITDSLKEKLSGHGVEEVTVKIN